MDLDERLTRYRAIEDCRGRPLIVYATSTRERVTGAMAGDAVREFIDQLDALEDGADEIVMHPHASLGPTDPQIVIDDGGQRRRFSFEDVGAFLRFLSEETAQRQSSAAP